MSKALPMFFIVFCSTMMLMAILGGFVSAIFVNLIAIILNIYLWVKIDGQENPNEKRS